MVHTNAIYDRNRRKHNTPTYRAWANMKQRCLNNNATQYYDYGGRGIGICDEWNSFSNFLNDMGEAPSGSTIERIDGDREYSKDNCKWADRSTQVANRRTPKSNTSGYVGVKRNGKNWTATVTWCGHRKNLGTYSDPELAALIRDEYIISNNLPHKLNT
jgi:hypothetical protein